MLDTALVVVAMEEQPMCNTFVPMRIVVSARSKLPEIAAAHNLPVLGRIPMDPKLAAACDKGMVELFEGDWLKPAADAILALGKGQAQ